MKHTDEDIEKVARAIGSEQDIPWFCFKDQAIAALDAMFAPEPARPREFWLWLDGRGRVNGIFQSHVTQDDVHFLAGDEIIHMREVME